MNLPNPMKSICPGLSVLALLSLSACGGASGSRTPLFGQVTGLSYTNPSSTGWRLERNSASTATHLILDLKAPASTSGNGAGLSLDLDVSKATWAKVAAADVDYAHNVAFDLGGDAATRLSLGTLRNGNLQVGVYQKGTGSPVTYTGAVLSLAIDLKASANLEAGATIPLSCVAFKHVNAAGDIVDLGSQLSIGTLKAQ